MSNYLPKRSRQKELSQIKKLEIMTKAEQWKKFVLKQYKVGSTAVSIHIRPNQNLGVEGWIGLAEGIDQIQILKKLYLEIGSETKIEVQGNKILGQALKRFDLTDLTLRFGDMVGLDDQGLQELIKDLCPSNTLTSFEMTIGEHSGDNDITEMSGKHIKDFLRRQSQLKTLQLRANQEQIGNGGLQFILESFKDLSNIKHLQILFRSCSFSMKGVVNLFKAIQSMKGLTKLQLAVETSSFINQRQEKKGAPVLEGITPLSELINNLPELTNLEVDLHDSYKMNSDSGLALAKSIRNHQKLISLTLIFREFSRAGLKAMDDLIFSVRLCKNLHKFQYFINSYPKEFSKQQIRQSLMHNLRLVTLTQYNHMQDYLKVQTKLQ